MSVVIALVALALVLLSLPWGLLWLGAPLWAPIAIDVGMLLSAVVALVVRWAMKRERAQALERAALPAKAVREPARPDRSAAIEEVRRELDTAIATITRSRLAGGGHAALMALPWYAVIGAPASGKTTLLRSSGLTFPSAPHVAEGRERAPGTTRRFDVWLGNEAVLLDTAGRWTTSEEGAEWRALLERLRKHRGARALDGILLSIALDELVAASDAERSALARQLRARLETVATDLGGAVPVYLVITKCDRLVGFSETFAGLDRRGRARPWGFTLDAVSEGGALEERVGAELETLAGSLRARVTAVLAQERRPEARGLVVELPAHFERAFAPLLALLSEVFVASVYRETPSLRGVYWTSATQAGRPVDRLLATELRAAGIEARALPEPVLEPRAYFVHQVLTRVAFADAETAAPSARARRRRTITHLSTGSVSAAFAAGLAITSAFSWQGNRRATDRVAAAITALPGGPGIAPPEAFDPLRGALVDLRRSLDEGPPWSVRLGLHVGPRLGRSARRHYLSALRDHVIAPLIASEASELETWGHAFEVELDREPTDVERERAMVLVERQLRLTSPGDPREPALGAESGARFARRLAEAWCGALSRPARECEPHAAQLVGMSDATDRPRVEAHETAVRLGRLALGRTRGDEAALAALVAAASGRGYDLTLARMIGTTGHTLTSTRHVRGAFTRRGWEEVVRARIDGADVDGERAWIVGSAADARPTGSSCEALRAAYFAAYVEEWRTFLASVRVAAPTDATEALALLEDMTRGTPAPVGRLLAALDDNAHLAEVATSRAGEDGLLATLTTRLTSAPLDDAAASEAPAPGAVVAQALAPYTRFAVRDEGAPDDAPLGADVYADELALLRDALATYRDDPTQAAALETRLVAARRRVDGLIAEQAPGTRELFEHVLRPPVDGAAVTSTRAMASAVGGAFCSAVASPFAASIAGRYPFAAHGDDAPLAEVAAFYRPGGTLWSYYDASLAAIAPREGARFVLASRLDHGRGSPFSGALPAFLARSRAITDGLFAPGGADPRIELDVRVHPTPGAASVRFSVGGATIDYRNGPESWSRIVWPGATPAAGARLDVESARGLSERITEDGEWGLFRLVEAATHVEARAGERTRTLRWHLPGHDVDVVIDLRPVRTECALFGDAPGHPVLAPLRAAGVSAPRRIAAGAECAP